MIPVEEAHRNIGMEVIRREARVGATLEWGRIVGTNAAAGLVLVWFDGTFQATACRPEDLARPPSLPYGLHLGQHLTDGEGLWRVGVKGLIDLAGDCDWDWDAVEANGGLGILRPPGSAENYREA